MTTTEGQGIRMYLVVYLALVVITASEFFVGYQNVEGGALVVRMLTFGGIQTLLVVLVLMNLSRENRSFFRFFVFFIVFVLAAMNVIWTDSFRLLFFRVTKIGPS